VVGGAADIYRRRGDPSIRGKALTTGPHASAAWARSSVTLVYVGGVREVNKNGDT
jgi:hypothetical protein